MIYEKLFNLLHEEHDIIALESDMQEIISIVLAENSDAVDFADWKEDERWWRDEGFWYKTSLGDKGNTTTELYNRFKAQTKQP